MYDKEIYEPKEDDRWQPLRRTIMIKTKIVEMTCKLCGQPVKAIECPTGFTARSLEYYSEDDLYSCYLAAFQAGDSKFFKQQCKKEQREFYETLAFEQARNEPGSSMILKGEQIVGFTFAIPYGEGNCHISCMCVHPSFQRQGLGTYMLSHAQMAATAAGCQTMTLWTEAAMGAYQLYIQHGFKITEEKEL
jgi:ribosomal protein S18 acetylase RimI-like enzyme